MEEIDRVAKERLHNEKINAVLLSIRELPSLKVEPFCWMLVLSTVFFMALLFTGQLHREGEVYWFGGIALFYVVGTVILKKFIFDPRYDEMKDEISKLATEVNNKYLDNLEKIRRLGQAE